MCRLLTLIMATLALWLPDGSPASAQAIAACPLAGTIVKARDSLGDYVTTFRGADPADSSICLRITERLGAANSGKEERTIYGWFNLSGRSAFASDQRQIARDALATVLNGTKTETTFYLTTSRRGTNVIGTSTNTLMRTGQAILTVGERAVNVITLRLSSNGTTNSLYSVGYYDIDWDLWYDPSSHLFVKGHVTTRRPAP
jgi:hypothetical protein